MSPLHGPLSDQFAQALNALRNAYDPHTFEDGQCVNLAVALVQLAKAKNAQSDAVVTIMLRDTYFDGDTVPLTTTFSHAFASIGDELIDVGGGEADIRWESRWDEQLSVDSDNEVNVFRYVDCPLDEIGAMCDAFGVNFDSVAQAAYLEVMRASTCWQPRPTTRVERPTV